MESIRRLLDNTTEIQPVSTGLKPLISRNKLIKAVFFDIYGTLLISSSGDIDQAEVSEENLKEAFTTSGIISQPITGSCYTEILYRLKRTVKEHHERQKNKGIPYPEINIIHVWEDVLNGLINEKIIDRYAGDKISEMAGIFELLCNRIYPMPNMKTVIRSLQKKNIITGIVSNAQFYTPVVMNYYLNDHFSLKEEIIGFDPALTVYSYKLGRSKPDVYLFKDLLKNVKVNYHIEPSEALFVGNDMLKDIYTANAAGLKTALFAGDKRSLRLREDYKEVKGLEPDYIITDLKQVFDILNI